jgi:ribosomal protein L7Ae-like RNA K-turn-binding protein
VSYSDFLNLLGLGLRAGKYELGSMACEKAAKRRRLYLLLLDESSAPRTIKNYHSLCQENGVELLMMPPGSFQAQTGFAYQVVGVKDEQFAKALIDKMNRP